MILQCCVGMVPVDRLRVKKTQSLLDSDCGEFGDDAPPKIYLWSHACDSSHTAHHHWDICAVPEFPGYGSMIVLSASGRAGDEMRNVFCRIPTTLCSLGVVLEGRSCGELSGPPGPDAVLSLA